MATDADGNFYNPYEPGTYEYDVEESQRSQPAVELTPEQNAQEIAAYQLAQRNQLPIDYSVAERYRQEAGGSDKWLNNILPAALSVVSLAVPGIGEVIGSAILESVGITGASAAVTAGVGSSALAAATTAASGGSVDDVLTAAAGAGAAAGINVGVGGGVTGAVAGSVAGTLAKGGAENDLITNAFAAGVGAGVQGALPDNPDAGKIIGTAARTYISTGGNVDQTLLSTAASAIGGSDKPADKKQLSSEELLTQQILAEDQNIGPNVAGIGGDVANVLASNIAAQQSLSPEAQEVVRQIDLASSSDPQAFAPALAPLLAPEGAALAGAAAAETAVLLARLAQTPAGQNAIRQAAAVNQNVMAALGTLGTMLGIVPAAFLAGDPLPQAKVQEIATKGPPADFGKFDPGTGTGWDATKAAPATKPASATARPPVDTTSPYPETAAARYPAPTSPTIGDNVAAVEPEALPQTAEVINVAGRLNITVEEAAALSQQSPALFSQVSGNAGTREFTPDELDKIRQTDLVAMGIIRGAGNIPSPEAVNQDFNVLIPGKEAASPVPIIGQQPTLATGSLDVINGAQGDPIYTKLDAAVKSGVDPYAEITRIASSQRKAGVDRTATVNSIMQTASQIGLDPQRAATTAINSWYSTEVSPSVEPSAKTSTQPATQPAAAPATAPAVYPSVYSLVSPAAATSVDPSVQPQVKPSVKPTQITKPKTIVDVVLGPMPIPGLPSGTVGSGTSFLDTEPTVSANTTTVSANTTLPGSELDTEDETETETEPEVKKPTGPIYPTVTRVRPPKTSKPPALPTIRGSTTARLLADSLAAYRPPGALEGPETGKPRQNVWNEKSLRLKDALGL